MFRLGYGQMLTPNTIGSFGSSKSTGGILLEDHIGSMSVGIISTQTFMYTQGFIQPDFGTTSGPGVFINDIMLDGGSYLLDGAGMSTNNGMALVEYTLGEFACNTLFNNPNILTQGLLQPKSCFPLLTLTPSDMPLMGSYQAKDQIIISGIMSINDYNVIFNAPQLTILESLRVHDNRQAVANSVGCVTN